MDLSNIFKRQDAGTPHKYFAKGLTPNNRSRLSTNNLPVYPIWFYQTLHGVPRSNNLIETRQFARSVWVQMIHFAIKKAVTQTKWDVVIDSDDPEINEDLYRDEIKKVKSFFNRPNRDRRSNFTRLVWEMLTDVLEINTGVWYLNGNTKDELLEIIPYDGSTFLVEQDTAGFIQKFWQFTYRNPLTAPKPFEPWQVAWFQMNKSTYDPYGLSPLQTMEMIIELMTQSTRFNKDFFLNDAIPSVLINAVGAGDGLQELLDAWNEESRGENSRVMAVDFPELQLHQLHMSNRDMEWLDGQKWFMHVAFAAHGLSPTEVGFTDSTGSKNVQEGQQQISIKNAHKPYLHMIEEEINCGIVHWILGELELSEEERSPLKFKFFVEDPDMQRGEEEAQRADILSKIKSINEVRKERGLEPLDDPRADNPFYNDQLMEDKFNEQSNQESGKEFKEGNEGKDDETSKNKNGREERSNVEELRSGTDKKSFGDNVDFKHLLKSVNPLDSLEYTGGYEEAFSLMIKEWEGQVVKGIEQRLHKNMNNTVFLKSFNDFMSVVIGRVSLTPFLNVLKSVVKKTLIKGVDEGEVELNVNVQLGRKFNSLVEKEALKQFDGYTLADGTKWVGISGVSKQVQADILNTVRDGVTKGVSTKDLIKSVGEYFEVFEKSRAKAIVRTETNRMVNEGKLYSYQESGVEGRKEFVAFDDERISDTCKSLNGQVVGLNDEFVDFEGKHYQVPPVHCNCRSFIRWVPKEDKND